MTTILNAQHVCKAYTLGKNNTAQVLRDVSLTIGQGEFVSIMGPSGSGKSTLLYSVSGMDRPQSGTITFGGKEISALSETQLADARLQNMGFIFQQSHLLKNLSIFDNIVVAAYLGGHEKKADIDRRALRLMEQTGIAHLKDNDIAQVSGGEMQRAAICRALINEPELLFGDEPTGALNSSAAAGIMDILDEVNRQGTALLLVTHDAKVAARSERVLFMLDGQIQGEYTLGKYQSEVGDWKDREAKLSEWLTQMGL